MKSKPPRSISPNRANFFLGSGFTICLILAVLAGKICACDFCRRLPGVPFELDHLAAIEVALATKEAAAQGQIDLNPDVQLTVPGSRIRTAKLNDVAPRQLITQWIRTRPAKGTPAFRCSIELILVDVDFTYWLDIRLGEILEGDPANGPADVRLTTTKAGFCRLMEDGLAIGELRQLVAIEHRKAADHEGLSHLFPTRCPPVTTEIASATMTAGKVTLPTSQFESP